MKQKEMRAVTVTYCDYCKKEITDYSSSTLELKDGSSKHFHSMYKGKPTCLELYQKQNKE